MPNHASATHQPPIQTPALLFILVVAPLLTTAIVASAHPAVKQCQVTHDRHAAACPKIDPGVFGEHWRRPQVFLTVRTYSQVTLNASS